MGFYIPKKKKNAFSIKEALNQAENDLYLDSPNADAPIRAAAFILDIILLTLIITTIQKLFSAISAYAIFFVDKNPDSQKFILITLATLEIGIKINSFYFYMIWSIFTFGGTAGKLLLGLRIISVKSGEPPTFLWVLIRETIAKLLTIVSIIGIFLPFIRKDHRTFHDFITFTTVKKIRGN